MPSRLNIATDGRRLDAACIARGIITFPHHDYNGTLRRCVSICISLNFRPDGHFPPRTRTVPGGIPRFRCRPRADLATQIPAAPQTPYEVD